MELGHESVQVWVQAKDCVGATWLSWHNRDYMGAINSVRITQDWAGVDQQMS